MPPIAHEVEGLLGVKSDAERQAREHEGQEEFLLKDRALEDGALEDWVLRGRD
jgi:hypothetical protein